MTVRVLVGDCREVLAGMPEASVQCVVTSPRYYGLRDYDCDGQIGLEPTPGAYVAEMVAVFREVRRVLRPDGTLWLNLGDSYAGSWGAQSRERAGKHAPNISALSANQVKAAQRRTSRTGAIPPGSGLKPKDLIGIPWMVAFALRADGWYLRQDCIWSKPNPMPESVQDRCTKAHEYVFLLSKSARYYFDAADIAEVATGDAPGNMASTKAGRAYEDGAAEHQNAANLHKIGARETRNRRSVWTIAPRRYSSAHFATMPPALAETCIKAGSKPGDTVLDPFGGAGTTGLVADRLRRGATLIELNPAYAELARQRINQEAGLFAPVAAE